MSGIGIGNDGLEDNREQCIIRDVKIGVALEDKFTTEDKDKIKQIISDNGFIVGGIKFYKYGFDVIVENAELEVYEIETLVNDCLEDNGYRNEVISCKEGE